MKAKYFDDLIAAYTAFRDNVYNPRSVLHSGCGFDASPSKVFANVTYVDKEEGNEGCVTALLRAGHHALKMNIREYTPKEQHDLLILLNPAHDTAPAAKHVCSGGWIIANDYHDNATEMAKLPEQYLIEGSISRGIVDRDTDGLFTPVLNAEELRSIDAHRYEMCGQLAQAVFRCMNWHGIEGIPEDFVPGKDWEQTYRIAQQLQYEDDALPYRKTAGLYIFRKR